MTIYVLMVETDYEPKKIMGWSDDLYTAAKWQKESSRGEQRSICNLDSKDKIKTLPPLPGWEHLSTFKG